MRTNGYGNFIFSPMEHSTRRLRPNAVTGHLPLFPKSTSENGSFTANSPATSARLILSFVAPPRILLNCPDAPRRIRVLPDLRQAQSRSFLPREGRKDLCRLLRYRARSHYRLPVGLLLSRFRPPP